MATMTMETSTVKRTSGGAFLVEDLSSAEIFTPEDYTEEQKQIAQMTADFAENQILPQVAAIEAKQYDVSKRLMHELGELGLLAVDTPEQYGGLELDKVTSTIVAQNLSGLGSFAVTFSAHTGIGMLPLIWYGTPAQRAKYLPKLASGEWIAAYALSESSAGSDAMNIRTRATLTPDGKHYVLNGEKMWISNAGFANLFTIFTKIDGEQFTAFLVEAGTEGLTIGAEEHKLGIRGSSTCALILNDCKVPAENLLGTAGKGHQIAFNVLNVGRYKLAANSIGGARQAFRDGIRYAANRVGFGKAITEFGLVQKKIAEAAAKIFALEAALYRVVGAIDLALAELDKQAPTYTQDVQKRIEEFAAECSILKFVGSEILVSIVNEMLQMHGGYGYVEEYPAERHYRDAKINMIFEGTNEINRLITTGWIVKRGVSGALPLFSAIKNAKDDLAEHAFEGPLAGEQTLLAKAKKIALFCIGAASERYGKALADQQEVMGAVAEIIAEVLMMESAILRAEKMAERKPMAAKLAQYYAALSFRTVESSAETVLSAVFTGEELRTNMAAFRTLSEHQPANITALGREISAAMVEAGQYAV